MSRKVEIEVPDGKRAEWVNGVLTLVNEKPTEDEVIKSVNNFADAVRALGDDHPYVEAYNSFEHHVRASVGFEHLKDVSAFLMLRIVAAALNRCADEEGFIGGMAYFPVFDVCAIDGELGTNEMDVMCDNGPFRFKFTNIDNYDFYDYRTKPESILFKTERLAKHAGEKFLDLWVDYLVDYK